MNDRYRESFSGKSVLITGGLGFIGSNLAWRLVDLGADVLLVDSLIPDYGGNLYNVKGLEPKLRINIADVRDVNGIQYLLQDQDFVFNLAGQVSHIDSMRDPQTDLEINCRSQLSLLECCRHHNPDVRVVFASTRQLYGRPRYLPVDEQHPLEPADVNGINKLAAEMYYTLYHQVYGIPTVSLRLTNTYGPRMELRNDKKGFAGIFIRKALERETIRIFGTGEQRRDFNYVDDVVEALLLAGAAPALNGDVFNLGHPTPRSLLEFVEALGHVTPVEYELVPFPVEAGVIDIGDYYGDFQKFHAASGWRPRVDLEEGLTRTIEYYRAHGWPGS